MTYYDDMVKFDSYIPVLKEVHAGKNVSIVAHGDDELMYEWDIARVYRVSGDNLDIYYVGSGSGCSCDSYGDYANVNDLMQFSSRRALLNYLRNSKIGKLKDLHSDVLQSKNK